MSNYDEKIYKDALKAAQPELGDEAEQVAKAFATAYAGVKNLKQAPNMDEMLKVCGSVSFGYYPCLYRGHLKKQ